ncbi:MAG: rhodoquinone biosynthesis methyltransferase RquA, partial [Rhodospirillales bacterium]|nr:rhodoquinone biosynthesis methyltransferase RquA [Rhodospirillales bacterium]
MDGTVKRDLQAAAATTTAETGAPFLGLPDYLVDTYTWAYLRPTSLLVFDNPWVVNTILWGNFRRLVRLACDEFKAGDRVLQAASVYGNLSASLAEKVGRKGHLEVIDIAPLQVEHCRRKLENYPQTRVRVADAAAPGADGFDAVCCFFLLHEVPDWQKRAVVD